MARETSESHWVTNAKRKVQLCREVVKFYDVQDQDCDFINSRPLVTFPRFLFRYDFLQFKSKCKCEILHCTRGNFQRLSCCHPTRGHERGCTIILFELGRAMGQDNEQFSLLRAQNKHLESSSFHFHPFEMKCFVFCHQM